MTERNLSADLLLLATEVDSLSKALTLARAESARERKLRQKADREAEDLRQQLRQARRRAKAAERELGVVSGSSEAAAHGARAREQELQERLSQAQQENEVLRHEVERTESERRTMEANLREVLGNLRHAARKAGQPRSASLGAEEATLIPSSRLDNGW
jgi:chromosome segregation ATPase